MQGIVTDRVGTDSFESIGPESRNPLCNPFLFECLDIGNSHRNETEYFLGTFLHKRARFSDHGLIGLGIIADHTTLGTGHEDISQWRGLYFEICTPNAHGHGFGFHVEILGTRKPPDIEPDGACNQTDGRLFPLLRAVHLDHERRVRRDVNLRIGFKQPED